VLHIHGSSSPSPSMPIEQVRPAWLNLALRSLRQCGRLYTVGRMMPTTARSFDRHMSLSCSQPTNLASHRVSDLGLRTRRPPDASPNPDDPPTIPDQEWEIRTGRAIYVIQETFPEFFDIGLIMSVNKATGMPSRLSPFTPTTNLESSSVNDLEEPIYSPNIRMSYTPPSLLPAPFPKTFHIEGLQIYVASSGIIRHTMNALYSDLTVKIAKLVINSPPTLCSSTTPGKRRISRDKSFRIRQIVIGISRVTGKPSEWEIESTYTFFPTTGLIHQHIVESILPAPHVAVYDSLRSSLGKLLGWEPGSGATTNEAICKGKR